MAKHIHIFVGPGGRVTTRMRTGDDFQESKHKRDEGGKFSSTGAGGGAEPKVKPSFNQHLSGKLKAKGFAPTKEKAPNGATIWHHAESGIKVHAPGIAEGAKAASGSSLWVSNKFGKPALQGSGSKELDKLLDRSIAAKPAAQPLPDLMGLGTPEPAPAVAGLKPDGPGPVADLATKHGMSKTAVHKDKDGTVWREYKTKGGGTVYVAIGGTSGNPWVSGSPGKQTKSGKGVESLDKLLQGQVPADATNHFSKTASEVFEAQTKAPAAKAPPPPAAAPASKQHIYEEHLKGADARFKQAAKGYKVPNHVQHSALQSYIGSGYHEINGELRKSRGAKITPYGKEIEAYINEASFPETMVLQRGVKGDFANAILQSVEEGTVFVDHGFTSMSTSTGFSGAMKMHITVPKGSKATAVSHIGGNMNEAEVLAQRGSRFRVTKIDGTNIHAELLPPKEKKP